MRVKEAEQRFQKALVKLLGEGAHYREAAGQFMGDRQVLGPHLQVCSKAHMTRDQIEDLWHVVDAYYAPTTGRNHRQRRFTYGHSGEEWFGVAIEIEVDG
jgi:hypothetical protein